MDTWVMNKRIAHSPLLGGAGRSQELRFHPCPATPKWGDLRSIEYLPRKGDRAGPVIATPPQYFSKTRQQECGVKADEAVGVRGNPSTGSKTRGDDADNRPRATSLLVLSC